MAVDRVKFIEKGMIMTVSDSDLHAYVDGELESKARAVIAAKVLASEELSDRVCALRSLKQFVRLAYGAATMSREAVNNPANRRANSGRSIVSIEFNHSENTNHDVARITMFKSD